MAAGLEARVHCKEYARHPAGKARLMVGLSFPRPQEVAFVQSRPLAHARIRSVPVPERYASRVFSDGHGRRAPHRPAGAVVNAIDDVLRPLGVERNEIPVMPRRVLAAILEAQAAEKVGRGGEGAGTRRRL